MPKLFEELAYRDTALGLLSLRRRRLLQLNVDVLEIKLGEEHLMSDLFTESEVALARLGLANIVRSAIDVVIGGLGLGYTARTVLEETSVGSLIVIEALDAIIDWHVAGLVPLGAQLVQDHRCRFINGDFFAMSRSTAGFDPESPGRQFDAILVDIDHAPNRFLTPPNAEFYEPKGLGRVQSHLKPGGVFGLWSDDPPDDQFTAKLAAVFSSSSAVPVTFDNPLQNRTVTQTIYLARQAH
jgi:spermidine synthase